MGTRRQGEQGFSGAEDDLLPAFFLFFFFMFSDEYASIDRQTNDMCGPGQRACHKCLEPLCLTLSGGVPVSEENPVGELLASSGKK